MKQLLALTLAAVMGAFVLRIHVETALHKAFWLDEGYEIVETCARPLPRMLLTGARECSPAPLYWLVQSVVVRSVDTLDTSLRARYRAVSLGAAALSVVVLLLGMRRLGLAAGIVAVASLLTQPSFHQYAVQNRAYMTWVLVTAILVITAAEASAPATAVRIRGRLLALLASGLLAGLTALPGCLQALAAFGACGLISSRLRPPAGLGRRAAGGLIVAALAVVAADVHYWRGSPCRAYSAAGHLDVTGAGDRWYLLWQVVELVWPDATSAWVWLGHFTFLLGAATPLVLWRRRSSLNPQQRFAVAVALVAIAQILVALPVGLGLAAGHYLFLPRMFVFLLVPRAVLVGVGFWTIGSWAGNGWPEPARRPASLITALLAVVIAVHSIGVAEDTAAGWRQSPPPVGKAPCDSLRSPTFRVLHRPQDHDYAFTPNFLARLGTALRSCDTPAGREPPGYLLAIDALSPVDWVRVANAPGPGYEPMRICGVPVRLDARGRLQ